MRIDRIEDLGTGCVYLQLLNLAHPDAKIPLHKLNTTAKQEIDNLANLKLVNVWLAKLGADKELDVNAIANIGGEAGQVQVPGQSGSHTVVQEICGLPLLLCQRRLGGY